jgi:hypothetical protein
MKRVCPLFRNVKALHVHDVHDETDTYTVSFLRKALKTVYYISFGANDDDPGMTANKNVPRRAESLSTVVVLRSIIYVQYLSGSCIGGARFEQKQQE